MINILYNLLLWLFLPVLIPYHCYRSISRGRRSALSERFGIIPQGELDSVKGGGTILVHAVSVGETLAAVPLLKALRLHYPKKKIVVSNVTETGRSVALKGGLADLCVYFPFDYPFAVRSVLTRLAPEIVIIMETEIWPNFIGVARTLDIPVMLANGRISDRSLSRYLKFSWFFRPVLVQLSALCMQTAEDAKRIVAIGARSEAVVAAGNLKYDVPLNRQSPELVAQLKTKYCIPPDTAVLTAASTHEGEEGQVIAAYRSLLEEGSSLFMILAPRHPERAPAVAQLLKDAGLPFALRTTLQSGDAPLPAGSVLLLDSVGELSSLFAASDLVFMGGSLVPTGGHNPLEPASCSVPVVFGPHMENFREIASLFLAYGAAMQVQDVVALTAALKGLLRDPEKRREMGGAGERLLAENAGATERHLEVVDRLVTGAGARGRASAHG